MAAVSPAGRMGPVGGEVRGPAAEAVHRCAQVGTGPARRLGEYRTCQPGALKVGTAEPARVRRIPPAPRRSSWPHRGWGWNPVGAPAREGRKSRSGVISAGVCLVITSCGRRTPGPSPSTGQAAPAAWRAGAQRAAAASGKAPGRGAGGCRRGVATRRRLRPGLHRGAFLRASPDRLVVDVFVVLVTPRQRRSPLLRGNGWRRTPRGRPRGSGSAPARTK
jgi:hypothetical protein